MGLFDDEKSTRLTITIKHADRRALIELAEREGVPMGKAATAALREGIKAVHAMEAAAKKPRGPAGLPLRPKMLGG